MPKNKGQQDAPAATPAQKQIGFETTQFLLVADLKNKMHEFFHAVARKASPGRGGPRIDFNPQLIFAGNKLDRSQLIFEDDDLKKLVIAFSIPLDITRDNVVEVAKARGAEITRDDIAEVSVNISHEGRPMRHFTIPYSKLFVERALGNSPTP